MEDTIHVVEDGFLRNGGLAFLPPLFIMGPKLV